MGKTVVVTDSTSDLEEAEAAEHGITVVPLTVHWNAESYLDNVELSIDEFYRKLREEKGTPRTSQPSVGRFEKVYRDLLEEADSIVSVHISGKVSGTVNAASTAANIVAPERVSVVDSKILCYPLGLLARMIATRASEGASLAECLALAEDIVPRLRLFAAMDTMEFLRRGGRVSRAQAFAGTLLSIKPIVQLVDGEIIPADRVRTRSASIKRVAELTIALGPLEEVAVLYGDDPQPAEDLFGLLGGGVLGVSPKRGRTGPVIGTHTGPGVYGAGALLARR